MRSSRWWGRKFSSPPKRYFWNRFSQTVEIAGRSFVWLEGGREPQLVVIGSRRPRLRIGLPRYLTNCHLPFPNTVALYFRQCRQFCYLGPLGFSLRQISLRIRMLFTFSGNRYLHVCFAPKWNQKRPARRRNKNFFRDYAALPYIERGTEQRKLAYAMRIL